MTLRTSPLGPPALAARRAMRPTLSLRDKRLTLAAATLGSFVALLDSTVVGIALPAISSDLGGGLESQQWIVNAYLLTLGSFILIGGSLGDVFGERRLFVLGAAGFGVASAGCALAPSVGPANPTAHSPAPSQSGRRRGPPAAACGIRVAIARATRMNGTLIAKIHRQLRASTSQPPARGPTTAAIPL